MKPFPITPPRHWLFETPDWFDLTTMGAAVVTDENHPDYGRVHGIWWDEDSSRHDGFVPPLPKEGDPFYAASEAVEPFFNGPLVYDEGNVNVGVVPLDHTVRDGAVMSKAELAAARWATNSNPEHGVTIGRVYADRVTRTTGPKAGTEKMVYRFAGAMRHGATPEQLAMVAASGMSGEWLGDETYGPVWVNRQGFPARHHGELALAAAAKAGPLCPPGDVVCIAAARKTCTCDDGHLEDIPGSFKAATDTPGDDMDTEVREGGAAIGDLEALEARLQARIDQLAGDIDERITPAMAFYAEAREQRIRERLASGEQVTPDP